MDRAPRRKLVLELDTADLDHPVLAVVEAGRFRIKDDFTHTGALWTLFRGESPEADLHS